MALPPTAWIFTSGPSVFLSLARSAALACPAGARQARSAAAGWWCGLAARLTRAVGLAALGDDRDRGIDGHSGPYCIMLAPSSSIKGHRSPPC